jgi:signal transduction histidine kinase/CheY-like chemotaxis protein
MKSIKRLFSQNVKGKVIIACLLACLALFLSWYYSRSAFRQMLSTVENIAAPNERLLLVNKLSRNMIQLDQLQRTQSLMPHAQTYGNFIKASRDLRLTMDTLSELYKENKEVSESMDSMKRLLQKRDETYLNYLKVRKTLVNNQVFSSQIDELSGIINTNARAKDSTLITSKKTTSKLTISTTEVSPVEKHDKKGLFGRLFGRQKSTQNTSVLQPNEVVNEELQIDVDTTALARKDSIMQEVGKTMRELETQRLEQNKKFISQEAQLINTGHVLITQMQHILDKVESEVVKQTKANNRAAQLVVNTGLKRIGIIMIAFLISIIILLALILTDISKSARYRKQLEVAKDEAIYHSAAKQRFLANMSHEIRTPLQSIIGYAELVKKQEVPQKKDLEAIYQSSNHLLQIVNEVLDYSRITSGKFTFKNLPFKIAATLEEVLLTMQPQADKKSITLSKQFELPADWVFGDPFRLKQILFNLLSNAIKFTDQGSVYFTASGKKDGARIHFQFIIKDTGIGITDKRIGQIFNAFENHNAVDETQYASTGLGLSIVKDLTEAMGGRIYATSQVQKGSVFTLYLTFNVADPVEDTQDTDLTLNPVVRGKVWIVDDDIFILDLCSTLLKKHHIEHQCFSSPAEIINTKADHHLQLILMDMRMPGMGGRELLPILKKSIPEDVKIYALTAQALPEEREAILSDGFDGLLMKPFREEELLKLIRTGILDKTIRKPQWDLTALHKMTFGDKEQTAKILNRFILDSLNDMQKVKTAMQQADIKELSLLFHRLAGRTAQLGAKDLAGDLRMLETQMHQTVKLTGNHEEKINEVLQQLATLIETIKTECINQYGISPSYYTTFSGQC